MADQHSSAPFIYPQGSFYEDLDKRIQSLEAAIGTGGGAVPDYSITNFKIADGAVTDEKISESAKGALRSGLSGMRNKLINPDFLYWQRGTAQSVSGYGSVDRWLPGFTGASVTHSQQAFTVGQTDVPGHPWRFSRSVVNSVTGSGNFAVLEQRIEDVRTLANTKATLTFWAKANAPKQLSVDMSQVFGSGGSGVSAGIGAQKVTLSTAWQRFSLLFDLPPLVGKVIGTNSALIVTIWFDGGTAFNARNASLGHQSGTFDLAHFSLVEGDARSENDPFSPRHFADELFLCQRYFQRLTGSYLGAMGAVGAHARRFNLPFLTSMRAAPTVVVGATSGGAFVPDEVTTTGCRGYIDMGNTTSEVSLADVRFDAEF